MAKQTSLIKINGKADGQSFYTSKNGGALMRSINKGMSARVKDAKEYANTRLNNAEFGAAGSLSGAIVKGVTSRWRFILSAIATGMLVKTIKKLQVANTNSPWGKREVDPANFDRIREAFTAASKNQLPEVLSRGIKAHMIYDDTVGKVKVDQAVEVGSELLAELQAIGANGFMCKVMAYVAHGGACAAASSWDLGAYTEVQDFITLGNSVVGTVNATTPLVNDDVEDVSPELTNEENSIAGVLVLLFPTRTIGGETQILQQHCSAAWLPIQAGTIE